MALWHFMQGTGQDAQAYSWDENGGMVSDFDDGLDYIPGEDGFTSSAADAKAASFGADSAVAAVYTGTPGYAARLDAEAAAREAQAAAEAKAQADADAQAMADAQAAAEAQAVADLRAQADAMIDAMLHPITPEDAKRAEINARFDALLSAAPDRTEDVARLRAAALAALDLPAQG